MPAQTPVATQIPAAAPTIFETIRAIIVDKCSIDEDKIKPTSSFVDDLDCDSLDTVEFIMELEKEFGILIPDLMAEKVYRVYDAVNYVGLVRPDLQKYPNGTVVPSAIDIFENMAAKMSVKSDPAEFNAKNCPYLLAFFVPTNDTNSVYLDSARERCAGFLLKKRTGAQPEKTATAVPGGFMCPNLQLFCPNLQAWAARQARVSVQ